MLRCLIAGIAAILFCPIATAGYLAPTNVTSTGGFFGSTTLLTNGVFAAPGSVYSGSTNVWNVFSSPATFTYNLGAVKHLDDAVFSVSGGNKYLFSYSTDGITFTNLFTVNASSIPASTGVMATLSTISGDGHYVSAIDFAGVNAQYVRFSASFLPGDTQLKYGISEVDFYGSDLRVVPAPPSAALLGLGVLGLCLASRRLQPTGT